MNRRDFIRALSGAGAVAGMGGATALFPGVSHAAAPQFNDYKALVVLFMHGGNDSYNMLVPLGSEQGSGYATYAQSRGAMRIQDTELNPLGERTDDGRNRYAALTDGDAYRLGVHGFADAIGVNGVMPELAQLFSDGQASAVANVGTLVEPVTKQSMNTARLPPFLFAHNHQQRAMKTGWADNLGAGGWAGRLADSWALHEGGVNGGSPLGMNVSFGGATRLMTADFNSPVVLRPGATAIFPSNAGFDEAVFDRMNSSAMADNPLRRILKGSNRSAVSLSNILTGIDGNYFASLADPYGNALFDKPTSAQLSLDGSLNGSALRAAKSAALMVKLGRDLQLSRQIVFIDMGGFDNHANLLQRHPLLLRELSLALWSFQQAMIAENLTDQVTLCTLSDFGRTLGNNGDGTDHAWGGHNLVLGGAVNGGRLFGSMPDMTLGGDNDTSSKGRMIPGIAVDQYLATLCQWFGVDENTLRSLFPNLTNFAADGSDPVGSALVQGMMSGQGGGLQGGGLPLV